LKLAQAQLPKLLRSLLRQLLRLTKTRHTQPGCCPCLLFQDISPKLRGLDALARAAKSPGSDSLGAQGVSLHLALSGNVLFGLLNNIRGVGIKKPLIRLWV
jgi:hypothetical protein